MPELTQDWKIDPWRAQAEPYMHQDPGERSSDPTRVWPRLVQECRCLQCRHGLVVACCRVGGSECSSTWMTSFKGGCHCLHYLHYSLAQKIAGREHSSTYQQKIGLKIYWVWRCPSEQDPVSHSVSLSHQEASISLLSFSIRGHTDWKPQSQKTNQSDHMDHSLV